MTIRFEEEMGMIPVLRRFETDSSALPSDLQKDLEQAVASLLALASPNDDQLRDAGKMKLAIDDRIFTLRRWEVPSIAKPLLDYLRSQAKPVPLDA